MTARVSKWQGRVLRDLVVAVVVVLVGGTWFLMGDVAELVGSGLVHWEAIQLDDLLLTVTLAFLAAGWFSWRRWRDGARQIAALAAAERERAESLRRLEELSSALMRAEERNAHRFAEVLHDEVSQTLYACRLKLDQAVTKVADEPARSLVSDAHGLADDALTRVRDLSMQLSPPALHDLGLLSALETLLARLGQRFALSMHVDGGAAWERIPSDLRTSVYRSVQELAVNAAKHAQASRVTVSADAEADGCICVRVVDDGRGLLASEARPRTGFGLFSVERRMANMHGKLELASSPTGGTVATLRVAAA